MDDDFDALDEYAAHFAARVLADAIAAVNARQLRERADRFEWAKPRAGDFTGQASEEQLRARWQSLDDRARAFRMAAEVGRFGGAA
ncbi:hypothetical protein [Nocardioides sp.]|uniref:hypothetical protein n=1 Tax=Nocardioides sp. TaxID=35761 RepID=UPI00351966E1